MADKTVEKSTPASNSGLVVSDQEQDLAQSALAGTLLGYLGFFQFPFFCFV